MNSPSVLYDDLLAAIQREYDQRAKQRNEARMRGTPSHNCNCLDYILGLTDGIAIARTEVEKWIGANLTTKLSCTP